MIGRQLARIFVWTEGPPRDPAYVREAVNAAVPEARALETPPVVADGVVGEWPADFWSYALPRLRAGGWVDPARYEMAGWAGSDSRDGARLFVVTVYSRPAPPPAPGGLSYGAPPGGLPLG